MSSRKNNLPADGSGSGFWRRGAILFCLMAAPVAGCGPNAANIQLRRQNQELLEQINQLRAQQQAHRARIADLERSIGALPTLPQERLDRMFTVHSLELGQLTGGTDLDAERDGDEGLRIYLQPRDETSQPIKATGQVTVEAFDLAATERLRLGRWDFDALALKDSWRSLGPLQAFVLVCPWQRVPGNSELLVKVAFRDELTGRTFSVTRQVRVKIPGPTATTQFAGPS